MCLRVSVREAGDPSQRACIGCQGSTLWVSRGHACIAPALAADCALISEEAKAPDAQVGEANVQILLICMTATVGYVGHICHGVQFTGSCKAGGRQVEGRKSTNANVTGVNFDHGLRNFVLYMTEVPSFLARMA